MTMTMAVIASHFDKDCGKPELHGHGQVLTALDAQQVMSLLGTAMSARTWDWISAVLFPDSSLKLQIGQTAVLKGLGAPFTLRRLLLWFLYVCVCVGHTLLTLVQPVLQRKKYLKCTDSLMMVYIV